MNPKQIDLKSFLMGLLAALALVVLVAAVDPNTDNIGGDITQSFRSVDASADGRIVYVLDDNRVYRSSDGGANWTVILKKNDNGRY